jgi:2-amino-4-hydroxy-6-hydroxymethyldihydropteridine diphosphokinase
MTRAVLSVGSNLDDRLSHLQTAVTAFLPYLAGVSPVFGTPAWGPVEQSDFLNAVLIVDDTVATAQDWLERGWACERAAGRTRDVHWGPRTLDVDVIAVDDVVSDDPGLTLPHPRAAERAFVLVPWLAIEPDAVLPGRGRVADLIRALAVDDVAAVQVMAEMELRP